MTERKQLWYILECMTIAILFAGLYAAGGSEDFGGHKWLRRILAPGIFTLWASFRSLDVRYIIQMPLMYIALTLPYGVDNIFQKVFLRSIFGTANGLASTAVNLSYKRYFISIFHLIMVVLVSTGAGAWNPFDNAMIEQFLIGLTIVLIPALTVRRRI